MIKFYCGDDNDYCVYDDLCDVDQRVPDNIEFEEFVFNKTGKNYSEILKDLKSCNFQENKVYDKVVLNEEKLSFEIHKMTSEKDETIEIDDSFMNLDTNQQLSIDQNDEKQIHMPYESFKINK